MMLFGSAEEIPAPGADAFTFQGGSNASELGFRQTIEIPGTVVIAALLWLLTVTGHLIPGVAGFVDQVVNTIQGHHR